MSHQGICLGGPCDGQWHARDAEWLRLEDPGERRLSLADFDPGEADEEFYAARVVTYRHEALTIGNESFGFWVPQEVATPTPGAILRALLAGYCSAAAASQPCPACGVREGFHHRPECRVLKANLQKRHEAMERIP